MGWPEACKCDGLEGVKANEEEGVEVLNCVRENDLLSAHHLTLR